MAYGCLDFYIAVARALLDIRGYSSWIPELSKIQFALQIENVSLRSIRQALAKAALEVKSAIKTKTQNQIRTSVHEYPLPGGIF